MRLRRLALAAFGPFTDVELDLGAGGPELHVVYGRNEAGKSTTLRAVADLLYGIPPTTRDHHVHDMPKLRIGAVLEADDGSVLEVRRRKGRKNTLLAPDDESAIDEGRLRAMLRGVGRDMFETVFGLSHDTLRSGANALLEGGGDVGESLFDAGIGGRGIHHVLERLEAEAAALWAPNASKRKLNQELRAYKEAAKQIKHDAVSSSWVQEQEALLESARRERDARAEEHRALVAERVRLERYRVVIPELARLDRLLAERKALGDVLPVTDDLVTRRREAQRTTERTAQTIASLTDAIDRLEDKRARLEIPEELMELDDDRIEELHDRLAAQRKAASDLPRRRAELRASESDAEEILRRLGRDPALDDAARLRVGSDRTTRIRALAERRSGLDAALGAARDALEARRIRRDELRDELGALGQPPRVDALERAVRDARRVGDIDERLDQARAKADRAEQVCEELLAGLGPWTGSVEEARGLNVPPAETLDRVEGEQRKVEHALESVTERHRELRERLRERRRELEALEGSGAVPSELHLDETRQRRDGLWDAVRGGADPSGDTGDALDDAIRDADSIADRLRREAGRVTQHAALEAELRALDGDLEDAAREKEAHETRRRAILSEWEELLAPLGLGPTMRPDEVRGWLGRLAELRRIAADATAARRERDDLATRRAEHRQALVDGLAELGEASSEGSDRLAPVLDLAAARLEQAQQMAQRRRSLVEQVDEQSSEVAQLEHQVERRAEELDDWRSSWGEAVGVLGLSRDATVEEAADVLGHLDQLHAKVDAARKLRQRIDAIVEDARRLDEDSRAVVERHAPDLAELETGERISQLVRRHRRMRHHLEDRESLDRELEERRAELSDARRAHDEAHTVLGEAMRSAGAETIDELLEAEERGGRARELDRQIADLEADLAAHGGGEPIEELRARTADTDEDAVRIRLSYIEEEIDEAGEKREEAAAEVTRLEGGLRRGRDRSAVGAAVEAQAHLAAIREHAHRYARARLAAAILRREVERYRERNQDPILRRAGELFPRLTLGELTGLRVAFDASDEPVLQCVRDDGSEVGVDGLSRGTRDQLYLALRVASLERHAEQSEPLPVVLDDVLIHFDEPRTRAALEVLGELGSCTQVLLFTHHAHVLELAREVVDPATLREHDLDRLRGRPEPVARPRA